MPGVTVTVGSPQMQGQRAAVSGSNGDYLLKLLPAGDPALHFYLAGALEMDGRTEEALVAARAAAITSPRASR